MTTAGKFHLTDDGPKICDARIKCRYAKDGGEIRHYESRKEAQAAWEAAQGKRHLESRRAKGPLARRRKEETVRGEPVFKFHRDIGFPPGLTKQYENVVVDLQWSPHAREAAANEEYGKIGKITRMDTSDWEIVEVKARKRDMRVMRLLYRSKPDEQGLSKCFVLEVEPQKGRPWRVVTAWTNEAWDNHSTLNRDNYFTTDEAAKEMQSRREQMPARPAVSRKEVTPAKREGRLPRPSHLAQKPPLVIPKPGPPKRQE